ncbi:hypothetical protein M8D60_001057 [Escherichia coli]|nr:hypothetical protein [Citrobacter portucalensis]ALD79544.1 hypothetical protein P10159_4811 [Citrobacter portucalensis]EJF2465426.1 hypothetical protein [Escherichia coli]MDT7480995.1 hypothetical protein [Citrobacter portucalensis]
MSEIVADEWLLPSKSNLLYAGFFFLVAGCGNAVPPPFAEALVRANLPELCQQKQIAA